jgi:hypothetical protein
LMVNMCNHIEVEIETRAFLMHTIKTKIYMCKNIFKRISSKSGGGGMGNKTTRFISMSCCCI